MYKRILLLTAVAFTFSGQGLAAEIDDIYADTEDITNESDAAVAETSEAKEMIAKEKSDALAKNRAAKRAYSSAAAKRAQVVEHMKRQEAEIDTLKAETVRLKGETEKLAQETAALEKGVQEAKLRAEKIKGENKALADLRAEKGKRMTELAAEKDKIVLDMKELDKEKGATDLAFQQLKDQEKAALEELERTKVEHAQKKARLEAHISEMKVRYKEAQLKMASAQAEKAEHERTTSKLEAQAKIADAEVEQAQSATTRAPTAATPAVPTPALAPTPSAGPTVAEGNLTLKRKCRVFETPAKGAPVIATQAPGTSVSKQKEGRTWISFKLDDGREGYLAKVCFN